MRYLFYYTLMLTLNFAQFEWLEDGVPIRQGLHIEWQRTGDANSDGSMIYAWSDCRNGVRDVIVQKVDVNGENLWGNYGVVAVNASGRQEDPQLVTDGSGGAYIIWMDYRIETDAEGDIYAQHVLSDGSLEWDPEGLALVNQSGQQSSPNICSDGQGGAYVIWKDNAQSSYGDIYATHLSSEGVILGGQGVPIITYSSYRSSPSLNTGGSGDAVLVWSDDRNADEDLYAQRISVGSGTINTQWGTGGKLVCDLTGDQTSPRVAQYSGDNTIITWEDGRNSSTDVYYQILDEEGIGQLDEGGVSACSGDWEIIKPRVKAENSVAYIVWEDRRNGWTSDIYSQKINSDGSTAWIDGLAITTSSGSQSEPRLTTDGAGGAYIIWEDQRNADESGIDIYAQHVNSNGEIIHDVNGKLICDAANLQFNPLIRNDGSEGAFIVWGDQRSGGSYGMFVQHLTASGSQLSENGKESFFGISTDAANEPYYHGSVYLENDEALVYWQDNRWGESKIFGTKVSSSFQGSGSDYFSNSSINGQQLTSLELTQETPKAVLAGDNIFLSFKVEESPNENLYFQLLNMDLSLNGSATALASSETSKQGFDMVLGNDEYIYYVYSEDYDIVINKINVSGVEQWSVSAVTNSADDIIKSVFSYPGSGCIIVYESQSFIDGSHIYALAVDGDGQVQTGWPGPVMISDLSGNQYFESSVETNSGIFITFKDNSSGNYNVYGQHVIFDGSISGGPSGIPIASGAGDQQSSSLAYNQNQDIAFVCYEFSVGSETDIHCNEMNLSNLVINETIIISEEEYNQKNPFVFWSNHSFMISWEDSRNSTVLNPEQDIYFQEYIDDEILFAPGGEALCIFPLKQERPIISKYSDSDNSYIILWEDYRSTGKEFCANLFGQTYISALCPDIGDINGDEILNVLDVVVLVNCVLTQSCGDLANGCAGDLNSDGIFNVLDVVVLVNCVLMQNCGGRVDDASESRLIIRDKQLFIEANGFIGGVQMTLHHDDNFEIKMTDRALSADYFTNGNETRLLVITPEMGELFSYRGDFEIIEIIIANSHAEVFVDLPLETSFRLGEAYPNPFNPITTLELIMPVADYVQVQVYNLLGQSVATLASSYKEVGTHKLTWDATNATSGMYFVKAQFDGYTKIQKIMLIK